MPLTQVSPGLLDSNAQYYGFKNRIINGAMVIDQRNAGASITGNDYTFPVDRFFNSASQTSKFTAQRNAGSVTPPAGFTNYLGITSSSAYSLGAGDYFLLTQIVEGFNCADLAWGTSDAQAVTLSFRVRSSLIGTFGGSIRNSADNRSYPFTYTISAANTWETKSITITGDTTGTWLTSNNVGIKVTFGLGVGTTNSATAGAWGTSGFSATGATSVVGTNGATFYITGVQLEKGSTATSFDYRPYGTELQLAQRYYWQQGWTSTYEMILNPCRVASGGGSMVGQMYMPTVMRVAPTLTHNGVGNFRLNNDTNDQVCNGITQTSATPRVSTISFTKATANMTPSTAGYVNTEDNNDAFLYFSAEL